MLFYITLLGLTAVAVGDEMRCASRLFNRANSQFSAKMFAEVVEADPGRSVVLSPFSVLSPLGQLSLASVGESHDEILRVIGIANDNVTKTVFRFLNDQLRSAQGIELKTANRIYVAKGCILNDDFSATTKEIFNSEVKSANFLQKQETAQEINTWVEQQTNNRIKDLVDPQSFGPDTRAVLVNAIYFKGSWLNKFDKKFTVEKDFHVTKEQTIKLPTMYQTAELFYGESTDLDAKILELPYEGYESSFYIFLPNQVDGLTNLEKKLKHPSAISRAIKRMYEAKVDVSIPKFKIETTTDLKNILTKIGASKMFDVSTARLDNLLKNTSELYISEAVQKAVIEINEDGAEAAAANEFAVFTRSFKAIRNTQFFADHPFYFALKYKTIDLFSGVFAS